jgi:hypothetical protein
MFRALLDRPQEALTLNKLNEKCITLVSLYLYIMMHGQEKISSLKQIIPG